MNLRKSFCIGMFLFTLICLTACTNNNNSSNPPYTPGCIASDLIRDINLANNQSGQSVINLPPNCIYTLTTVVNTKYLGNQVINSGLPHINSEITINGNNAVIDIQEDPGELSFGHFFVKSAGDLELYDLTLQNGARYAGGAVVVVEGKLFASNTNFLNNFAYSEGGNTVGRGGAIYNESGEVRIIDNSLFQDNLAGYSTGVGNHLGGAIYSKNGSLNVYSSSFNANAAAGNGGAIYTERDSSDVSAGLVFIEGCSFSGNWAYVDGGAVALVNEINGPTFITDSVFFENHADVSGGAIYSKATELRADHDTFDRNLAAYGGAIYSKKSGGGNPSILSSEESTYDTNSASQIGGAIFSENSDLSLKDSRFEHNTANSCGALRTGGHPNLEIEGGELSAELDITASIEISGGEFFHNHATLTHGGAICHLKGELSIQGTGLTFNQATEYGGALLLLDKTELSGVLMSQNSAMYGGGAAIGYPPSYIVHIPGEHDFVGPLLLNFNTQISESHILYNHAGGAGGGIYADHGGRVSIFKSIFNMNSSTSAGGGIYQYAGDLYLTNSTFTANSASSGGGVRAYGCLTSDPVLDIKHSTFAHNVATNSLGGGGLNYTGKVTIKNSLITLNTNKDCRYSQCPSNNFSVPGSVDSDGSCVFSVTEPNPMIGPLSLNGGTTNNIPLLPGSPLIDILPDCAGLTDDQRGVSRPQPDPGNCDPGSFEFDPTDSLPPPPPPPHLEPSPSPDPEISTTPPCAPFEELEYALILLNIPQGTSELTLHFKLTGGDLEVWDAVGEAAYRASLGNTEAEGYQEQGYPDRIYFHFLLPESALGSVQDFRLFRDGCDDPLVSIPRVSIPEPYIPDDDQPPSQTCKKGLDEESCKKAGGTYVDKGLAAPPECVCP